VGYSSRVVLTQGHGRSLGRAFVNVLDRHANPRATVPRRSLRGMRPDQLERRLRERLDALGPAPRAELLHVLMLPDFDRADRIGEFLGLPAEPHLRRAADRLRGGSDAPAVLVGMLREADRGR
jgi:hypothetical protein